MFSNIGGKIKKLATAIFTIETILIIVSSFAFLFNEDTILMGIILLIGGILIAWVSSWLLYGFGELIEKTTEIAHNTQPTHSVAMPPVRSNPTQQHTITDTNVPVADTKPVQTTYSTWSCPHCGKENLSYTVQCKACGRYKS